MKRNSLIILLFSLLLISCNKIGIKDWPIPVEQVFGTYDLRNGKKITFNTDSTYIYWYVYDDTIKNDTGVWRYQYFDATKTNQIFAYDMRAVSENGEKNYYTEYATFYFYVCKHWGKIIITNGYEGDPDGAPALKWYKKIK